MRKIAIVAALLVCSIFFFTVVQAQRAPAALDGGGRYTGSDVTGTPSMPENNDGPQEVATGTVMCGTYNVVFLEVHGTSGVVNGSLSMDRQIDAAVDCPTFTRSIEMAAETYHCTTRVESLELESSLLRFVCHGPRDRVMRAIGAISDEMLAPGPRTTPPAATAPRD